MAFPRAFAEDGTSLDFPRSPSAAYRGWFTRVCGCRLFRLVSIQKRENASRRRNAKSLYPGRHERKQIASYAFHSRPCNEMVPSCYCKGAHGNNYLFAKFYPFQRSNARHVCVHKRQNVSAYTSFRSTLKALSQLEEDDSKRYDPQTPINSLIEAVEMCAPDDIIS